MASHRPNNLRTNDEIARRSHLKAHQTLASKSCTMAKRKYICKWSGGGNIISYHLSWRSSNGVPASCLHTSAFISKKCCIMLSFSTIFRQVVGPVWWKKNVQYSQPRIAPLGLVNHDNVALLEFRRKRTLNRCLVQERASPI